MFPFIEVCINLVKGDNNMGYTKHEKYKTNRTYKTSKRSTKIWRYMDFAKFVNLLCNKSLFFCRSDKFEDPYEGSITRANYKLRESMGISKSAKEGQSELFKNIRKYTFINCWHMNDVESNAMWKLYLNNDEGIAIQSTVGKLIDSINTAKDVKILPVTYINYEIDYMPTDDLFCTFVHKEKAYSHEREIRAIIQEIPKIPDLNSYSEPLTVGLKVEINLDKLIDSIYVSPTASTWLEGTVKSVIEAYKIEKPVLKSKLIIPPVY